MSDIAENLNVEPDANLASLPAIDYSLRKRRILFMLLGYSALLGVFLVIGFIFNIFNPEDQPNPMNIVIQIPSIALTFWWCLVDADQHDHTMGKIMRIGLILATIVAFPIYIFRTRGIAGFRTLLLAVLFLVAMSVCVNVTAGLAMVIGVMSGLISPNDLSLMLERVR